MTTDPVEVWAVLPRFMVEDGAVPEPRRGVTIKAGLTIDVVPQPGVDEPERQVLRGRMRRAAHAVVIEGSVIAIVVGVDITSDTVPREVEVTGILAVEPYLWGAGAIRDAAPAGWRDWTVEEVETISGGEYRVLLRAE